MAERYLFFDSTPTDRREYNSQDFALYFNKVLSDGLFSVDGNPILNVEIEDGTLNYTVTEGSALIKGHLYVNTSDLNKTFENPDPDNDRIDRIVLQLDLSQEGRFIKVVTKTGVPSSDPVAPELVRGEAVYELSLGQILVKKNTASVNALNYKDERLDEDLCGIVNSQITAPTEAMQQQFDAWFDSIKAGVEGDVNDWVEQQQKEFTEWMNGSKEGFDEWFESIKGSLEGDVAANLTQKTTELREDLDAQTGVISTHIENDIVHVNESEKEELTISLLERKALNVKREGKDEEGVFTVVTYFNKEGKSYQKSSLIDLQEGLYLKREVITYKEDGISELNKVVYDITYDEDGDFVEEKVSL